MQLGSTKANGREPKSYLGQVFYFKFGSLLLSRKCRALYYKTFYGRNLRIFVISQSVCPWQAFPAQPRRVRPSEAPFRCSTLGQAPCLTHKHQTRLERLSCDKCSSLLRTSVKGLLYRPQDSNVLFRREVMRGNQLPVPAPRWQHCSQIYFET